MYSLLCKNNYPAYPLRPITDNFDTLAETLSSLVICHPMMVMVMVMTGKEDSNQFGGERNKLNIELYMDAHRRET